MKKGYSNRGNSPKERGGPIGPKGQPSPSNKSSFDRVTRNNRKR